MSTKDSYDTLRRHARTLETALDSKLTAYSKLASKISRPAGVGSSSFRGDDSNVEDGDGVGGYKLVEEEVEELCAKVRRRSTTSVEKKSSDLSLSSPLRARYGPERGRDIAWLGIQRIL